MKIFLIIIALLVCVFSQTMNAQNAEPKFHGYILSRLTKDFDKTNDFMIRRAKLWVDGNAPGLENISNLKTQFSSIKK